MKELAIAPPIDGGNGSENLTIPGYSINPPDGIPGGGGVNRIEEVVQFGVTVLLVISIVLALFFLIYGGIKWITSGGDKAGVDAARKILTYAIIGLIIVFASFLILRVISGVFGVNYLQPLQPRYTCGGTTRGTCQLPKVCTLVDTNPNQYFCMDPRAE